jgi:hypothetical protein
VGRNVSDYLKRIGVYGSDGLINKWNLPYRKRN